MTAEKARGHTIWLLGIEILNWQMKFDNLICHSLYEGDSL
jgi:hypothetical protein